MGARTMFSKFKSSTASSVPMVPSALGSNPISNQFQIGKQSATAGPENIWRVLEGYRKSDGKEVSIFLFEKRSVEKIYKPKRKETITEMLRVGVRQLERCRHPKILQVVHTVEECPETLAFVSEPVYASLANVFAAYEQRQLMETSGMNNNNQQQIVNQHMVSAGGKPNFVKEYELLDIEIKYGLLQCIDALSFLHNSCQLIHRNVCPSSIIITKRGTWKLFGFEFTERANERDTTSMISLPQWMNRLPKIAQPNLDYIAPEVQLQKMGSSLSDMYSLGMLICSIFNHGRPLIQASNNVTEYLKQIDSLENLVENIMPRIVVPLQEAVTKLLSKDPKQRPIPQLLILIKYFSDPSVHALQFLDVINMKDAPQKSHFYKNTLIEVLPYIPRKLWYQHIWPYLQHESRSQESFAAVLQPMLYIIQNSNIEDYENIILPSFRLLFSAPRSIQGSVVLLENMHIILEKTSMDDITRNILPMLYNSFESNTIQIQTAAFVAVSNVTDYMDDLAIRRMVLPKLKVAFEKCTTDQRILMSTLWCILDRLEKQQIIDDVLPLLWTAKLHEPEIISRVINIYRFLLGDKKYGIPVNVMATHVMPSLLPQTVSSTITLESFTNLIIILQEMLGQIERNQGNKLKLDNLSLPSPERHRPLRHQYSTDNMNVPPFNIPNLRIEQRKTSSAEDMARKNSIGSIPATASAENMTRKSSLFGTAGNWFFGSTSSANNADNNFLHVASFMTRRLSDNTLLTPKIKIAPSCASSPGGTPGGGLPIRRHSSTCPQERRGSNMNLSPPSGSGFPISSSSVPYLLTSSMTSIRGSRRPSVSSNSSQQGAGLLQQFGSGMVRQHPPICLNLNGPQPSTLSPSFLQPSGQPSH